MRINPKNRYPDHAVISITDRCNSRCSFCNVWRTENPADLKLELIDKLPATLKSVDITGGEPLLHKDFVVIVKKFTDRGCRVIVNTNGLVKLIKYGDLWKKNNIGIRFSLDGIGEAHDALRGVQGNYERVLEEINYLKSIGFKNIGISSTFSDTNIDQAEDIYKLSKKLHVDFTFMIAGNSEIYYKANGNIINDPHKVEKIIRNIISWEIRNFNIKKWGKAVYMNELIQFMNGAIRKIDCPAAENFFFMQPSGNVYACNMRNLPLGNLSQGSFDDIWFSSKAESVRKIAHDCTTPCWTMCNAKQIISANIIRYLIKFGKSLIKNSNG